MKVKFEFEDFVDIVGNSFSLLNKRFEGGADRKAYYDRWCEMYSKYFDFIKNNDSSVIEWNIRTRKSLKEIYTSASFFIESKYSLKQGLFSSYFYLSYYALFHAMLSVIMFDYNQSIDKLIDINHSKVCNVFLDRFCLNKFKVFDKSYENHFKILKYYREYYSYVMPLNEIFDIKNKNSPLRFLENDIMQCFQLANLHSNILKKVCEKKKMWSVKINNENIGYLNDVFNKINSRKDINNRYILDPSDERYLYEIYKYGCDIQVMTLDLEHFEDEYRLYYHDNLELCDREIYDSLAAKTSKFVYDTLIFGYIKDWRLI